MGFFTVQEKIGTPNVIKTSSRLFPSLQMKTGKFYRTNMLDKPNLRNNCMTPRFSPLTTYSFPPSHFLIQSHPTIAGVLLSHPVLPHTVLLHPFPTPLSFRSHLALLICTTTILFHVTIAPFSCRLTLRSSCWTSSHPNVAVMMCLLLFIQSNATVTRFSSHPMIRPCSNLSQSRPIPSHSNTTRTVTYNSPLP